STLQNALTPSATWSHKGNHFGYEFTPRTGNGTMANGGGGAGTVWTVNNGNWASTWSNGGGPIAAVNQAPRNAEIKQGKYDFAISVRSVDDTTNEVKWYMIAKDNSYWFGGTVIDKSTTKKFNSVIFGINEVEYTAFNVIAMKVDLGDPIIVPEAPWQSYYIDQWGLSAEYNTLWPILNDTNTLVGDASMGGDVVSGWKGLQGGFGQDVSITTEKAVIVKGQIEFVGADAGDAYTVLRYALTYQDSNSTLQNALTDSATWSHKGNHFGYEFTPRTGNGTMANGGGGAGTVWTVNNGNWASTWSNGGGPINAVNQAPRNAEIVAGKYNFAISVISIDDTTNEVKWYMIEKDNKYWFGGTTQGKSTTKKFNSLIFGVNEVEYTAFNVIAMKVDLGDPIEVPKAPWDDFYVDKWGIYGGNNGGWNLTPGEFTGNVDFNGTAAPTGMAVVRGDLGTITPEPDVDIFVLKGDIILEGGGFDASSSLRFGLFKGDNAGSVDSLANGYNWNGTDDGNSGYLILAQEGSNNTETWSNGAGNWGRVTNDVWSNYSAGTSLGDWAPLKTTGGAGTYKFAICVAPKGDGTSKVLWTLKKADGSYNMEGGVVDNAPVLSFNSFVVGIGNGATATTMLLRDVQATMAAEPIILDVEEIKSSIPTQFALSQNYPNPFNPSTTIEFALPKTSDVKITVYNILGSEVGQLVSGVHNAGYYKVSFDASNLASGIYFYSIKAGDFASVKKLVLLK
ncbi:MAG: T9SS type A sorting domain-containing protein, partial [Bacteroidetes bacterium]|nr:T9SS type A sorting domain-containing protein [Bacteroidota bacterium]